MSKKLYKQIVLKDFFIVLRIYTFHTNIRKYTRELNDRSVAVIIYDAKMITSDDFTIRYRKIIMVFTTYKNVDTISKALCLETKYQSAILQ